MRSSKIRPMVDFNAPTYSRESARLLDESDHRTIRRNKHDYIGRRLFLQSYKFSLEESFKERLQRTVKKMMNTAREIAGKSFKEAWIMQSRLRVSHLRVSSTCAPFRCFGPNRAKKLF
ncbi:hypothetical protein AMTR_s00009p00124140 [Amborella trichopoda]|uniref:Uncharacterized protein n=1 Tax=Amborella trichopoda TaxID=13333 RepID=W1NHA7_AMBTC|nr:hypothetical protein AMTR_s00009p00124140 [Amborella trichopoda]